MKNNNKNIKSPKNSSFLFSSIIDYKVTPGSLTGAGYSFLYDIDPASNHQSEEKMVYKQINGIETTTLDKKVPEISKLKTGDLNKSENVTLKAYDEVKTLTLKDGLGYELWFLFSYLYN